MCVNLFVISLMLARYHFTLSSASYHQRSIVQYDTESQSDVVFSSAALDQRTSTLYVYAGAGSVYRFGSSLSLESRYSAATRITTCDDAHRRNGTIPTTATDKHRATGIVRLDSTSGLLLACGGRCGHCSVLSTTAADVEPDRDLQALDQTSSASYITSRVVGAGAVMVFAAKNATENDNSTLASRLFVAGATASGLEAVSVRQKAPRAAAFDVVGARFFSDKTVGDSYRFVDALDSGDGFVYFVAVRRYERRPLVETRLVRVCRDDNGRLDSYVEVKLNCQSMTDLAGSFGVAVSAHVAPLGADLASRFLVDAAEPAIYLVAEGRERPSAEDGSSRWTSGICVYTMQQVNLVRHRGYVRFRLVNLISASICRYFLA